MFVCLLIKKPFSFFFFHMNFEQNMNKNIQKTQKINKFCTFLAKLLKKKCFPMRTEHGNVNFFIKNWHIKPQKYTVFCQNL